RRLRYVQPGQSRVRSATLAVALERYRRQHSQWPETLQAVVPGWLAEVPEDPHGNGPLRYARLPDGIVVYSVGRDGRDNGGRVHAPIDSPGSDIGFRLWDEPAR